MTKILPIFILLIFLTSILFSETNIEMGWDKIYGDFASYVPICMIPTLEHGFLLAGSVALSNSSLKDIWVLKFNHLGMIEWANYYGAKNFDENVYSIAQTKDKGYIICGDKSLSGKTEKSSLLIKIDFLGTIEWEKVYGSGGKFFFSIFPTKDRGYILCGKIFIDTISKNNMLVSKINKSGIIEWEKNFGDSGNDAGYSIIQTFNGGYAAIGAFQKDERLDTDFWIVILTPRGEIEWQRYLGGERTDNGYRIFQARDQGFVIWGGMVNLSIDKTDSWLIKFDRQGNIEWDKSIGGFGVDRATSIYQTALGGFIITGYTGLEAPFNANTWMLKLDEKGNNQLDYEFLSEFPTSEQRVIQTYRGDYIISGIRKVGEYDKELFIFKFIETVNEPDSTIDISSILDKEGMESGGSRFIEIERERESYFKASIENPEAERHFDDPGVYEASPLVRYFASYGPLFRLWSNRYQFNYVFPYLRRLQKRHEYRFVYRTKSYWELHHRQMQYIEDLSQDRTLYSSGIRFPSVFSSKAFFNTSFRDRVPAAKYQKKGMFIPSEGGFLTTAFIPMIFLWLIIFIAIVMKILLIMKKR